MQLITSFLRFLITRSPRNATALRRAIKEALVRESVREPGK